MKNISPEVPLEVKKFPQLASDEALVTVVFILAGEQRVADKVRDLHRIRS